MGRMSAVTMRNRGRGMNLASCVTKEGSAPTMTHISLPAMLAGRRQTLTEIKHRKGVRPAHILHPEVCSVMEPHISAPAASYGVRVCVHISVQGCGRNAETQPLSRVRQLHLRPQD